jgi:hypothetical protein
MPYLRMSPQDAKQGLLCCLLSGRVGNKVLILRESRVEKGGRTSCCCCQSLSQVFLEPRSIQTWSRGSVHWTLACWETSGDWVEGAPGDRAGSVRRRRFGAILRAVRRHGRRALVRRRHGQTAVQKGHSGLMSRTYGRWGG